MVSVWVKLFELSSLMLCSYRRCTVRLQPMHGVVKFITQPFSAAFSSCEKFILINKDILIGFYECLSLMYAPHIHVCLKLPLWRCSKIVVRWSTEKAANRFCASKRGTPFLLFLYNPDPLFHFRTVSAVRRPTIRQYHILNGVQFALKSICNLFSQSFHSWYRLY